MSDDQKVVRKLVEVINAAFPQEGDNFNSAVFFHHDADGELRTCSPMIAVPKGEQLSARILAERLLIYSDACREMAEGIIKNSLSQS